MLTKIARKTKITEFLSILFLGIFFYASIHYADALDERVLSAISKHSVEGTVLYMILIFTMVLFIPISTIPFIPFAIKGLGAITGGLATLLAWEASSYVAFNFARKHRSFFKRHIALIRKTSKHMRSFLTPYSFSKSFILRLIFPIGIMSYVFGFSKTLTKKQHFIISTAEFSVTILFTILIMYSPKEIKPFSTLIIFAIILYLAIKTILKLKG